MADDKKGKKKGKKPHVNKPTSKKYTHYSKASRHCPRCGPGIFLAQHGDRMHCGKCNYTEFGKK